MSTYPGRFKAKIKTTSEWAAETEPLLLDELGYEDKGDGTLAVKRGDGSSLWDSLDYAIDPMPIGALADSTTAEWDSATPGELKVHLVRPDQINFAFDTNNTALVAPLYVVVPVCWAGTITASTLLSIDENGAALAGSGSIEVWKKAGGIPTSADKISGSDPLALASASYARKTSFSGWSTLAFAAGDVLVFKLASSTTCKRIQGSIEATPASS